MHGAATDATIDATTAAYIECALWSDTGDDGEPLDATYSACDLAPETCETMRATCASFLHAAWDADLDLSPIEPEQIGHDFWLTRNGHGTGFWDRDLGELGDRLTELCRPYGESHLYVGDDGSLYVA